MGFNVVISEDLTQFIKRKVESGEYGSADELIENAVRMLKIGDNDEPIGKTDGERLVWLRSAYLAGLASGDAGPLDFETLKAEARRRRALSVEPSSLLEGGARGSAANRCVLARPRERSRRRSRDQANSRPLSPP